MENVVRDIKIALLGLFSVGVAIGWALASLFRHLLWEPQRSRNA